MNPTKNKNNPKNKNKNKNKRMKNQKIQPKNSQHKKTIKMFQKNRKAKINKK